MGVITRSDLLMRAALGESATASALASSGVVSIPSTKSFAEASALMVRRNLERLPVDRLERRRRVSRHSPWPSTRSCAQDAWWPWVQARFFSSSTREGSAGPSSPFSTSLMSCRHPACWPSWQAAS